MWNCSYRTPTERWQKTSDLPKCRKLPTYLGRAKEKRKNRDKRIGTGPAPVGGSCEERFPHTRKPLHWWRRGVAGGSFGAVEESAATGVQRAGQRDSRQRISADQHSPAERLVCSPTGAGGDWELRLRLWRSGPGERTGVS